MTTIIDGKALAKKINAQTKELVAQLKEKQNIIPGIAVVIAGDDAASLIYTRNKHNKAIKLGINSVLKKFPADVSQAELLAEIEKLNHDDTIDAILVQQPLPPQLDSEVITNAILPAKDVDGLNPLINMVIIPWPVHLAELCGCWQNIALIYKGKMQLSLVGVF